jgi:hypothetical protein
MGEHAELASRGDRLQTEVHQVNIRARYLRFSILSGHGEFATVNRYARMIDIQGSDSSVQVKRVLTSDHHLTD